MSGNGKMIRPTVKILLFALIFCFITSIPAARAGTGMVEMLNLTGARQTAMGETLQLFDHDPFNLEFNPASIVGLQRGRLGFSHNSFIRDRNTNALAAIFPAKGIDFGVHLRLSSSGDIEARGDSPTSEPDYTFNACDFAVKLFSAIEVVPRLQAGLSLGWLMEKIDIHRGSNGAFGLGAIYYTSPGPAFHASVSNFGPKFSFIDEKEKLPTIYRAGVGYSRNQLYLAADYVNIKSGDGHFHLGAEYLIEESLYLRTGYQTGYDSRDFSAGAGFVYNAFRIDYAFVPYKSDLGNSHRFTFTILLR